MTTVQSYRELIAWQKAMDLVVQTYCVTRGWPRDELYGLTNQVRRASVSVPANIAEGITYKLRVEGDLSRGNCWSDRRTIKG